MTENLGGWFVGVECVCSDEEVHRGRVSGRQRGILGWPNTVSWGHVLRMRDRWEPWDEPHLVIDTVEPIAGCVRRIADAVGTEPNPQGFVSARLLNTGLCLVVIVGGARPGRV